ncbi:MAG: ATP-dependent DNA helicase [bacterium]
MKKYFLNDLPEQITGYEEREQQLEMAELIKHTINGKKCHLIIEAGTGIGKTYAYLIPLAEYAIKHKVHVFVSTYTKALQQQLYKKDLPTVKKIFPELKFEVAYGQENYLCVKRNQEYKGFSGLFHEEENFRDLLEFLKHGDGVRENAGLTIPDDIWRDINRQSDTCGGEQCMYFNKCHYYKMLKRLQKCHIIVINHHLFFSNLLTNNRILPAAEFVMFDEGHRVEDTAREMLSDKVTSKGYYALLSDLEEFVEKSEDLKRKEHHQMRNEIIRAKKNFETFTAEIYNDRRIKLYETNAALIDFHIPYKIDITEDLKTVMRYVAEALAETKHDEDDLRKYFELLLGRVKYTAQVMSDWVNKDKDKVFYWVELEKKENFCFFVTPFSIAEIFKSKVLDGYDSVMFTSATLAAGEDFSYITKQLGIEGHKERALKSPFDFMKQSVLYIEKHLPEPNLAEYPEALTERLEEIISITGGSTLILFTSRELMKSCFKKLKKKFNMPFMIQGEASHTELIEKFKKKPAVLFATNTFWQGIDIKGKILKCVVITRLPFEMPEHPIQKAIQAFTTEAGGNHFMEYSLPRAIFMLKQGFGRLIRSKEDTGAVLILDKRILTKAYGRDFLKALPETNVTHELKEVEKFFKEHE